MGISVRTKQTQLGRETTAGTAVAATTRWTGPCAMTDPRVIEIVEESIGQYADRGVSYIADLGEQTLAMESHPASFEEILHTFEAGLKTVSPIGADPYTYSYVLPGSTTDETIKTYTLETGDGVQAYEMAYAFVTSLELSGGPAAALMHAATWRGRQWGSSTFTPALSLPSPEIILFPEGKLYIDAVGDTIGTTQVSASFVEFNLAVDTGLRIVPVSDGELYFLAHKRGKPKVTLSITAEHTAANWDADSEYANFIAKTPRQVRVEFDGTNSRKLTLDLAGLWTAYTWGDRDGNRIVTATMEAVRDATAALFFEAVVINKLATVP